MADVTKGSPAETAGIKRGDVIVSFDGKDVAEMNTLPALVAATAVDKAVPVKILRNASEQSLSVKAGRAGRGRRPDRRPGRVGLEQVGPGPPRSGRPAGPAGRRRARRRGARCGRQAR